jgi:hypothetical protein
MTEFRDNVMSEFFPEEWENKKQGRCPFCKVIVDPDELRDELSKKEYYISGMCQECQDKVFGK